ncbi:MAG: hypothetical protein ACRELB_00590 [Polyangiaceae bacterium]
MRDPFKKSDGHPTTDITRRHELEDLLGWFFSVDDGRWPKPYFDERSERHLRALRGADACEEQVHRQIWRRLARMSDHDAGVLQAVFAPRAWPRGLRRELGRLTGIIVRLVSAGDWPAETTEQDLLEMRVATQLDVVLAQAGGAFLAAYRVSARALLRRSLGAYEARCLLERL